jgi:hypothetical protein
MNGFCRKLASCVLKQDESEAKRIGNAKPILTKSQVEYLKKYVLSKTPGSGKLSLNSSSNSKFSFRDVKLCCITAGLRTSKLTKAKEAMSDGK